MRSQWYLRTQDETFGPETKERLVEWARMGRIQPGQDISDDGETWRPATEIPFLDMRWSIDIGDGNLRGPFNKAAADAESGAKIPETFEDYLNKWVYGCKDQEELLDKIGGSRLMRLKNEPHLGYSTTH